MGKPAKPQGSDTKNRRQVLGLVALAAATPTVMFNNARAAEAKNKRRGHLIKPTDIEILDTRCKIVLEVDGSIQLREPDPNKPKEIRSAEVRGKSTLEYFEKSAFRDGTPQIAARQYSTATSENWLSGKTNKKALREVCRQIKVTEHSGRWQQYCEQEPLEARELELLTTPVNSAFLENLLPSEPAKPNTAWEIGSEAAKQLFNLEAVHECELKAKISKVEKGVATISLAGKLDGTANSVSTKIEVEGSFRASLAKQGAMVSWFSCILKEQREISNIEPGFKITARVRLIRAEFDSPIQESRESLLADAKNDQTGRWLIKQTSVASKCQMLTDRRWRMFIDGGEEVILRMVENDMVLAQCNVSRLPKLAAGEQITMEGFQADVESALGSAFGEMLQSSQKVTSSNLSHIRAVAGGELDGVPIQWIYNHLADDSGKRYAMVFTLGGNVTDRFGAADEQMADSFRMNIGNSGEQTALLDAKTAR